MHATKHTRISSVDVMFVHLCNIRKRRFSPCFILTSCGMHTLSLMTCVPLLIALAIVLALVFRVHLIHGLNWLTHVPRVLQFSLLYLGKCVILLWDSHIGVLFSATMQGKCICIPCPRSCPKTWLWSYGVCFVEGLDHPSQAFSFISSCHVDMQLGWLTNSFMTPWVINLCNLRHWWGIVPLITHWGQVALTHPTKGLPRPLVSRICGLNPDGL